MKNNLRIGYRILSLLGFVAVFAVGGIVNLSAQGLGDLLVTPTRLTFEGSKRNEVLTLVNRGNDSATYELSVIQYRMTLDGRLEEITEAEPGQLFATDMIRFFPRRVTLAPKEVQNVRVQLKKPEGLADGEYRSHLYFRAVPKDQGLDDMLQDSAAAQKEFAIKLTPIYGVTVPVIVRSGDLNATITIDDLRLESPSDSGTRAVLNMKFVRKGSRSVYGDVHVKFVTADNRDVDLGVVNGVAVYTPNFDRGFQCTLKIPEGIVLRNGRIVVEYTAKSDLKEPTLLATAEITI